MAVLARSNDQVEETVRLARGAGGAALAVPADVTDRDACADAHRLVADAYGSVDILVNNAAVVGPLGASVRIDPDEWAAAMDVNVNSAVRLTFAVLPAMVKQGWGRIVNVSSGVVASPEGMIGGNAYTASKAAAEQ